jgi:PAS domain S-box-containing protein
MPDSVQNISALTPENRLAILIDAVVDCGITLLDPDGVVATWNVGDERLQGYTAAEIVGRHFSSFYTTEDQGVGEPQRALAVATNKDKYEKEGWCVRKDGSRYWASVVMAPVRDARGNLLGFARITRDISQRRLAQQELEQARAAVVRAQKMEAVGQLTGGIAHDFNNLLTVIANSLDLLTRSSLDERKRLRIVDAAQRAAERGARLTQQLLAFARRQPLRPHTQDINTVIRGFEAVLRRACGETVEVFFDLSTAAPGVNVDTSQLEAALLNLAVNARDAMPQGGMLTVTTAIEEIRHESRAALLGLKTDTYTTIALQDTGSGMTSEVKARAFEPFYTTKETGKGSGLGLSQVYGFVSQSGGSVDLGSEPDSGTCVTLYLPFIAMAAGAGTDAGAGTEKPAGVQPQPRNLATVLVVEDDPEVLEVAVETVRSLGYNVVTAADGPSALGVLRRSDKIDVLFTDIVMPHGMNGVELAREARRVRADLRILLASGYPMAAMSADQGLRDDFLFLTKPYRWSELADKLRAVRATH